MAAKTTSRTRLRRRAMFSPYDRCQPDTIAAPTRLPARIPVPSALLRIFAAALIAATVSCGANPVLFNPEGAPIPFDLQFSVDEDSSYGSHVDATSPAGTT